MWSTEKNKTREILLNGIIRDDSEEKLWNNQGQNYLKNNETMFSVIFFNALLNFPY